MNNEMKKLSDATPEEWDKASAAVSLRKGRSRHFFDSSRGQALRFDYYTDESAMVVFERACEAVDRLTREGRENPFGLLLRCAKYALDESGEAYVRLLRKAPDLVDWLPVEEAPVNQLLILRAVNYHSDGRIEIIICITSKHGSGHMRYPGHSADITSKIATKHSLVGWVPLPGVTKWKA